MTWNDLISPYQSGIVRPRGHGMNDRSSNPDDCRGAIALVSLRYAVLCCARIQVQCQNKLCHSNQRSKRAHVMHRYARYIKYHQVTYFSMAYHGIILLWCNQRRPSNWQMWKALVARQYNLRKAIGIWSCLAKFKESQTANPPCHWHRCHAILASPTLSW